MPPPHPLLAQLWRRTQSTQSQPEGWLEDALAVALQHSAVWPWLQCKLNLRGSFPASPPTVTRQDWLAEGRTDIQLSWPGGTKLIFELKVGEPPSKSQLERYATEGSVLAIARI
jgi:hypothetical protein